MDKYIIDSSACPGLAMARQPTILEVFKKRRMACQAKTTSASQSGKSALGPVRSARQVT